MFDKGIGAIGRKDLAERHRDVRPRQWVSGESMLYLGRRYVLKVIQAPEQRKVTCKLIGGQLRVQGKELSADRIQLVVPGSRPGGVPAQARPDG